MARLRRRRPAVRRALRPETDAWTGRVAGPGLGGVATSRTPALARPGGRSLAGGERGRRQLFVCLAAHRKSAAAELRAYAPKDETLHRIAETLQAAQRQNFYQLRAKVMHRGNYYHAFTMAVSVTRDSAAAVQIVGDAEAVVTDALRDLANWLYRQLEQEYDYLTSDEAVDETLVVGGYTFTEEGRRFG